MGVRSLCYVNGLLDFEDANINLAESSGSWFEVGRTSPSMILLPASSLPMLPQRVPELSSKCCTSLKAMDLSASSVTNFTLSSIVDE